MTEWNNSVAPRCITVDSYSNSCDRKVQIGCTEIENLDRLSDLGMTEMDESVRPKRTKKFWKFKSMTN